MDKPVIQLDCARCGAPQMTHDVIAHQTFSGSDDELKSCEMFCRCRSCGRTAIWGATAESAFVANLMGHNGWGVILTAGLTNLHVVRPKGTPIRCPASVPDRLREIFDEGATCLAIEAPNGAGALFRKILDVVSKTKVLEARPLDPPAGAKQNLKRRLDWLFEQQIIPPDIERLANCVREDANDAVHDHDITMAEANDLADFTIELLERLYTMPARLTSAEQRRLARRSLPRKGGKGDKG